MRITRTGERLRKPRQLSRFKTFFEGSLREKRPKILPRNTPFFAPERWHSRILANVLRPKSGRYSLQTSGLIRFLVCKLYVRAQAVRNALSTRCYARVYVSTTLRKKRHRELDGLSGMLRYACAGCTCVRELYALPSQLVVTPVCTQLHQQPLERSGIGSWTA